MRDECFLGDPSDSRGCPEYGLTLIRRIWSSLPTPRPLPTCALVFLIFHDEEYETNHRDPWIACEL